MHPIMRRPKDDIVWSMKLPVSGADCRCGEQSNTELSNVMWPVPNQEESTEGKTAGVSSVEPRQTIYSASMGGSQVRAVENEEQHPDCHGDTEDDTVSKKSGPIIEGKPIEMWPHSCG